MYTKLTQSRVAVYRTRAGRGKFAKMIGLRATVSTGRRIDDRSNQPHNCLL